MKVSLCSRVNAKLGISPHTLNRLSVARSFSIQKENENQHLLNSYKGYGKLKFLDNWDQTEKTVQKFDELYSKKVIPIFGLSLFLDLQHPLLKKYKFDPIDFLEGAKFAYERYVHSFSSQEFYEYSIGERKKSEINDFLRETLHPQMYANSIKACIAAKESGKRLDLVDNKIFHASIYKLDLFIQPEKKEKDKERKRKSEKESDTSPPPVPVPPSTSQLEPPSPSSSSSSSQSFDHENVDPAKLVEEALAKARDLLGRLEETGKANSSSSSSSPSLTQTTTPTLPNESTPIEPSQSSPLTDGKIDLPNPNPNPNPHPPSTSPTSTNFDRSDDTADITPPGENSNPSLEPPAPASILDAPTPPKFTYAGNNPNAYTRQLSYLPGDLILTIHVSYYGEECFEYGNKKRADKSDTTEGDGDGDGVGEGGNGKLTQRSLFNGRVLSFRTCLSREEAMEWKLVGIDGVGFFDRDNK